MPIVATPRRRRIVMAVLLSLAVVGALVRWLAPQPSTLHDVGTLLLVLWLPAVGNLIAFLARMIPRRPVPATEFAVGSAFAPQLRVRLEPTDESAGWLAALDADTRQCTLIVGRLGFTARLAAPLVDALDTRQAHEAQIELLHPGTGALVQLVPGKDFFLLAGTMAVARGRVLAQLPAAAASAPA